MMSDQGANVSREMEQSMAQMDKLKAQMDSITMQMDSLKSVILDHDRAIEVLGGFDKGSPDDVLIPVGGQILIRAKVRNTEHCIMEQGAGIMMDVPLKDAVEKIKERKERLQSAISELERNRNELASRYGDVSNKTQQLYNEQMRAGSGPERTF